MKHLRKIIAATLLAGTLALGGAGTKDASALSSCTIVGAAHYTSTRCDSFSNPELMYSQYAKHTCHTAEGTFVQKGYRVPIHGVSSAGYCDGYITNRLVQQW